MSAQGSSQTKATLTALAVAGTLLVPVGAATAAAAPASPAGSALTGVLPQDAKLPLEGLATAPTTPKVREFALTELTGRNAVSARAVTDPDVPTSFRTRPRPVTGYGVVGATWEGAWPKGMRFAVRTRLTSGEWSPWTPMHGGNCPCAACVAKREAYQVAGHGPNAGTPEFRTARPGTDALAVGDVDQVQVRVSSPGGVVPEDLTLSVVDPEPTVTTGAPAAPTAEATPSIAARSIAARSTSSSSTSSSSTTSSSSAQAAAGPARPTIFTRAQWGADERMRSGSPSYGTIKAGFVHHTVNANDYTAEQVPSILRGIYAYHTQSRGWSDIGYNFLVDRFGRIWEGRYGGIDRPVLGAHTYGYNHLAFAMSAIGNFDVTQPSDVMVDSYARLYAWKLSLHGIGARSTQNLAGKDFNAISGHRDAGQTACPGQYLYAKLPTIRKKAAQLQGGESVPTPPPPTDPQPTEPAPSEPTPTEPAPTQPKPTEPAPVYQRGPDLPRDLSGDGMPDLLARDAGTGRIKVIGPGPGPGFSPAVTTGLRTDRLDLYAGVGDLTGDGEPDLLTRVKRTGLTLLRPGRPNGDFGRPVRSADTMKFSYADYIAGAGNLVRDRRPDLLVRDAETKNLYVHPGRSGGKWGAKRLLVADAGRLRSVAGAGDVDGDGRDDVLAVKGARLMLFRGLGKGQVAAPRVLSREWRNRDLTFAGQDLTGDGARDLLARDTATGQTWIYALEADGRPGPRFGGWTSWTSLTDLSVLGDAPTGARLLARTRDGRFVTLDSLGTDWLAPAADTARGVPDADFIALAGDWNGDGHPDVISRTASTGHVFVHPGTGTGQFGQRTRLFRGWTDRRDLAVSGDLTGDGFPDLVARDSDGSIYLYPGDGQGGKLKRRLARSNLFTTDLVVPVGYWNGDEVRDLIVRRTRDQRLYLLAGTTQGTLKKPVPITGSFAAYDRIVGVGDRTGDGLPDLVATEAATGRLWLFPGTANGLGEAQYLAPGLSRYDLLG